MLRSAYDYYTAKYMENNQQRVEITVKPFPCGLYPAYDAYCVSTGNKVTIYNKLRDQMRFKVGAGLTFQDIVINSIDSIILPNNDPSNCLSSAF